MKDHSDPIQRTWSYEESESVRSIRLRKWAYVIAILGGMGSIVMLTPNDGQIVWPLFAGVTLLWIAAVFWSWFNSLEDGRAGSYLDADEAIFRWWLTGRDSDCSTMQMSDVFRLRIDPPLDDPHLEFNLIDGRTLFVPEQCIGDTAAFEAFLNANFRSFLLHRVSVPSTSRDE